MFLSFCRPRAEFTKTCLPSKSTHTGVTCGVPSGIIVARFAKAFLSNKSLYFSGITSAIAFSFAQFVIRNLYAAPLNCDRQGRERQAVARLSPFWRNSLRASPVERLVRLLFVRLCYACLLLLPLPASAAVSF